MQALALNLVPRGAFHLGERGVGAEETTELAHADTLFSGLCWAWWLLYGETSLTQELLLPFRNGPPPFLLSSALPYAGPIRFWPQPAWLPWEMTDEERLELKKVRYVSTTIFRHLVAGQQPPGDPMLIQDNQLWLAGDELSQLPPASLDRRRMAAFMRHKAALREYGKPTQTEYTLPATRLWEVAEAPHVTLDRVSSASEIFHVGDVRFAEGCGPYVLVRFLADEAAWRPRLLAAFRLMGDEGLGGRRSTGRGQFDLKVEDVTIPEGDGDRAVLLSLLNPTRDETSRLLPDKPWVAYSLITRRGWVYSDQARNLWRKRVTMLAEGSVVARLADERPPGRLVPALEKGGAVPHNVYRYGYGFLVPLKGV
ncbi:MAG: type III-A CRISPR-associated RAMP protein Csm4 [Anaerolineales bacterium]|nr:MAG: type III-A CRISPR-associated RAMP protein Csm4 [Anaerolineales bacterium]